MSKDNLELWHKVEKTNPNYTKKANVKGNKITSISPQFQIMNVTEQFGIYGVTWGLKETSFDYSLVQYCGLVIYNATFFFPNGEFQIKNSISLYIDNAKTKVDDNFAKKVETDTLTKAIAKLGFNADIFMGKFDDVRYLEEVTKEFNPPVDYTPILTKFINCKTIEELKTVWLSLDGNTQKVKEVVDKKDEIYKILAPKK